MFSLPTRIRYHKCSWSAILKPWKNISIKEGRGGRKDITWFPPWLAADQHTHMNQDLVNLVQRRTCYVDWRRGRLENKLQFIHRRRLQASTSRPCACLSFLVCLRKTARMCIVRQRICIYMQTPFPPFSWLEHCSMEWRREGRHSQNCWIIGSKAAQPHNIPKTRILDEKTLSVDSNSSWRSRRARLYTSLPSTSSTAHSPVEDNFCGRDIWFSWFLFWLRRSGGICISCHSFQSCAKGPTTRRRGKDRKACPLWLQHLKNCSTSTWSPTH